MESWDRRLRTLAILASCLLALGAGAARSQDLGTPLLLVASPAVRGFYSQTMLVAVPTGNKHLGFIVNRATRIKLATLFPSHAPSAKVADPVYFGGPEMVGAIFAVIRRNPGANSLRLFGDLFVVGDADGVDRIIEQTPNDARYFTGFVGWQPGELAKEIKAGYWYVTDPDPGVFFRRNTSGMWEELVERLGNGHAPQRARLPQGASREPISIIGTCATEAIWAAPRSSHSSLFGHARPAPGAPAGV